MRNSSLEKVISKFLYLGTPLITLFVIAGPVGDPVNVTKLFLLGMFGTGLLFILISLRKTLFSRERAIFSSSILLFIFFSLMTNFTSAAPFNLTFYGVNGRNTGFLSYFFFSIFALAGVVLSGIGNFKKLIYGFYFAGVVNILYCLWAWQIGDFIPWNNIYGQILGTFGNPNFIGAFLGMVIVGFAAQALQPNLKASFRILIFALSFLAFLEILASKAIQGLVVTFGGLAIVLFYWLRSRITSKIILPTYVVLVTTLGVIAGLGALQKGPLASVIYKRSVSLRGSYWDAGIEMGLDNLVTGVGMDAYGNNYRRYRSLNAFTDMPGPETISNAAHNVVIDIFAFGGLPLLFAYLLMIGVTLASIIRFTRRNKHYDFLFVAMTSVWICYQVQSLISINQIGLAVWGWLLSGALIAYEISDRNSPVAIKKSKNFKVQVSEMDDLKGTMSAIAGMVVGVLIALPPLAADMKWVAALKSQNLDTITSALKPSYFNPTDSARLVAAVTGLQSNNFNKDALEIARRGVDYNPDFTDAWKMLYYIPIVTEAEKELAKENLIRLDPLNPMWKELP
jgi:O-antigen ligase